MFFFTFKLTIMNQTRNGEVVTTTELTLAQGSNAHILVGPGIEVSPELNFDKAATEQFIDFKLNAPAEVRHEVPLTPSLGRVREPHAPLLLGPGCYTRGIQQEWSLTKQAAENAYD